MIVNYRTQTAKALIGFCCFFAVNCLTAQNTGSYKYIVNTVEDILTYNFDILEIDNRYYLLSNTFYMDSLDFYKPINTFITIFDEDLNSIEQITLSEIENFFAPFRFFYENNYLYIFGSALVDEETYKPCFAKFDKNFNLVQPVSIYTLDDNLGYAYLNGMLMTEKKEFVFMVYDTYNTMFGGRLFHINDKGEVLEEVFLPYGTWSGVLAETDSHYIVNFTGTDDILLFGKDSFGTHEWLTVERNWSDLFYGNAITVGNQLIRGYDNMKRCVDDESITDIDVAIVILDEDFSVKHRLIVGNSCVGDVWGIMHYLNPDSIYYAYQTSYKTEAKYGNTISIANFSLEGELNFDYRFDLPRPADSLYYRRILQCQAVSNGGVLVCGIISDYSNFDYSSGEGYKENGFLLYYHPTIENLGIKKIEKNASIVSVFPNPTRSQFTVTNTENTEIQLFNTLGQEVFRTHSTEENTVVEVGSLPQGVYMLKVVQKDGSFSVRKVVKQ